MHDLLGGCGRPVPQRRVDDGPIAVPELEQPVDERLARGVGEDELRHQERRQVARRRERGRR
jgi:hypothetical protein